MNQELTKSPQEARLSTADIANANQRTSSSDLSESLTRNPMSLENNKQAPMRSRVTSADEPYADIDEALDSTPLRSTTGPESEKARDEAPLFSSRESNDLHARWDSVQVSFVDAPRSAVQQADALVAEAMKRLAEIFAEERATLDKQWDRGDVVSTEDLRLALQRYRSFFGRLLAV